MQPSKFITPGRFKTVTGEATVPIAAGHRIIINVCDDSGKWENEFSTKLSKRWKKAEQEYNRWYRSQYNFKLGELQEVGVQSDTLIVNALVRSNNGLSLDAFERCVDKVGEIAYDYGSSVHVSQYDDWQDMENTVVEKIIKRGINVTVYKDEGSNDVK